MRRSYILVVEGDDLIRELVGRWLGEEGYLVVAEDSASGGARAHPPSLVIADLADPRRAAALIRSLQAAHAAPIIGVSARFRRGLGKSRDAARRLGVCKVLPKPFTREELLAAVRESLEGAA